MLKFLCPAKINLFLKVTGKRPNGYHELESLFAFLDLTDELEVKKSHQFKLEIGGEFFDKIDLENNLFTKILDFFVTKFGISKNLEIKIIKNIPVAAGLGGGSSDAAYFLHALNKIFTLNLSLIELQKVSLEFGSDIAFLLQNKAAIVRGRGEEIISFPAFKEISVLLINPKISVSTKEIFTNFSSNFSVKTSDAALLKKSVFDLIKNFPNDMEKTAISRFPVIDEILQELKNHNAEIAKMSGSGATCFAIFKNNQDLEIAKKSVTKKFPNFFIKQAKILSYV